MTKHPNPITVEGIVRIHLSNGMDAIVDFDDYEKVCHLHWSPKSGRCGTGIWYAVSGGIGMHRFLMGCLADHRDGDGLNNRRSNLRPCTPAQNKRNARKCARPCTSMYKGVRFHKNRGLFEASVYADGKRTYLGAFSHEDDAAWAYDSAALELHGEFARINFPEDRLRGYQIVGAEATR